MSPELAYLKGVCLGDGGLYPHLGSWTLGLGATDREFVEEFRRCAQVLRGALVPDIRACPPSTPSNPTGVRTKYLFACDWTHWPEIFAEKGGATDGFRGHWLRGLYDSEGSVNWCPLYHTRWISFSNSNRRLLHVVHEALTREGINPGKLYLGTLKGHVSYWRGLKFKLNQNTYYFCLSSQENLILFYERIGFTIRRKQQKLKGMLNSYKRKPYATHRTP